MHVQDKRVFDFKPNVLAHFDSAETVVLELNMDSVNPFNVMKLMVMDSSIVLSDLFSPEEFLYVSRYIEDSLSLPIEFLEHLQPLFISSFVAEQSMNQDEEDALDLFFFKRGKLQNKRIVGLEKAREQIAAFSSIPYKEQAQELLALIQEETSGISKNKSSEELIKYYLSGNLDSLIIVATETQSFNINKRTFEKVFLVDRNQIMVNRLELIIKNESAFIAVGAAHLPGNTGIIQLLREKGYTVEPR